jgi:hypothetical protein
MKKALFSLLVSALALQGCGETALPDPNPQGSNGLDIEIDINNSTYSALKQVGGSALLNTQKIRVARYQTERWSAVQGYCPSDATVALSYNHADLTYRCSKDNSVYGIDGKAKSGSSTNLKVYNTSFSANSGILRIFE